MRSTRHALRDSHLGSGPALRGRNAGFSLTELLIATALAASLMIALTAGAQLMGEQVEDVRDVADTDFETSVNHVIEEVRRGWVVERPSADRLDLRDASGGQTSYYVENDELKVARPSGEVGTLLGDVASVNFDVGTVQRLREAPTVSETGSWWSRVPSGPTLPYLFGSAGGGSPGDPEDTSPGLVTNDQAVAIGFRVSSGAPSSVITVSGVEEEVLDATLDGLSLPVSFAARDSALAGSSAGASSGGGSSGGQGQGQGQGLGQGQGQGSSGSGSSGKVTICHVPPGNPANAHTISVGASAVPAHLAHGCSVGACSSGLVTTAGFVGIELYEARVPGDGRPYGVLLGATEMPADLLPPANYTLVGGQTTQQGNKTIYVTPPTGMLVDQPLAAVPIDLTAMGITLEPGKAYTLVLRYTGDGMVAVRSAPDGSGGTEVAAQDDAGSAFVPSGVEVQVNLDGTRVFSQTAEHQVIARVSVTVTLLNGRSMTASAAIDGQLAATNPWHGAVPGELPSLESYGQ